MLPTAHTEQTPGGSEGQGSLVCCCPEGCKESDMTQRLNNSNIHIIQTPINGGKNECLLLDVKDTEEATLFGKE